MFSQGLPLQALSMEILSALTLCGVLRHIYTMWEAATNILKVFFYFISLSQSCQTTAGIRATNTNVDSASLVFSPGQRYLRQIVFNNVKLLNV